MRSPVSIVDVERHETWSRYRPGLCDRCQANCCTMPVEVRVADLVRLGWVEPFEAEHEDPRQIAKRLMRSGQVEHFSAKFGIFTLARRSDGDCALLHPTTRRCTVYEQRPDTCRKHPQQLSPRAGHCPFGLRTPPRKPRDGEDW